MKSIRTLAREKTIALVAHDNKKGDLVRWIKKHGIPKLTKHNLIATETTGKRIEKHLGVEVKRVMSGPLGGDQQLGSMIAQKKIDIVIFFWDPMEAQPHDSDGEIASLGKEIPTDSKILLLYGGGSIKKNGIYQQVMNALENHDVEEFGGIPANPEYETLIKALEIIKEKNITYLLAVGGGSVIDGTKYLAAAAKYSGEPWDILKNTVRTLEGQALPFATVLTLPATGSEMNSGYADALVSSGLYAAGYRYINVDDGYFGGRDEKGNLITDNKKFPSGMKNLATYIHSKRLKAGIYSDAGKNTCGSIWDNDKQGFGVGLYGHLDQDSDLFFKDWKYDFIKVDWCGGEQMKLNEQEEYTKIINKVGRGMSYDEDKTHFSMWALLNSPLLAGNDLRSMSKATIEILTNKEIIALNQDTAFKQAQNTISQEMIEVLPEIMLTKGQKAIAIMNRGDQEISYTLAASKLGLNQNTKIRDLWLHKNLGKYGEQSKLLKYLNIVKGPKKGLVLFKETQNNITLKTVKNEFRDKIIKKPANTLGYSRDTFYRYKELFEEGGKEALRELSLKTPNVKNRVEAFHFERKLLELHTEFPAYGQSPKVARDGIILAEAKFVALKKDKEENHRHGEIETHHPGLSLAYRTLIMLGI
ncbi:hypothetical protein FQR65_LT18791 [Abscondita terminalis]|nr:hypothetical protein FQR65_LT18791 [Abscondita terminalis]